MTTFRGLLLTHPEEEGMKMGKRKERRKYKSLPRYIKHSLIILKIINQTAQAAEAAKLYPDSEELRLSC